MQRAPTRRPIHDEKSGAGESDWTKRIHVHLTWQLDHGLAFGGRWGEPVGEHAPNELLWQNGLSDELL